MYDKIGRGCYEQAAEKLGQVAGQELLEALAGIKAAKGATRAGEEALEQVGGLLNNPRVRKAVRDALKEELGAVGRPSKISRLRQLADEALPDVPSTTRRAPAPDNYRGRFNADRHAQGRPRLPDEYDAHHRIPQEYMTHSEFKDFDFHEPSNIQGVKGSRADVNTHQLITNDWAEFGQLNPNATRAQIEAFAAQIDARYAQHWFE